MLRKYEYPGIHRTLFWVLRAWQFYLSIYDKSGLEIARVNSGYRCWEDNYAHHRSSTNHMGKALDIHVYRNGLRNPNIIDDSREVLIKYSNAQYRWGSRDRISLEPGERVKTSADKALAPTWTHYDVRAFSLIYLEDKYFVKSIDAVNGKLLADLFLEII